MDTFVQALFILSIFLGFIFAVFCEYKLRYKDIDKEFNAEKDSKKSKKKK